MAVDAQDITFESWVSSGVKQRENTSDWGFSPYKNGLKRIFDITLVLCSVVIVFPLIAVLSVLVSLDGHSPFYTQDRVGRQGKIFRIFKLRSMVPNADELLEAHLASNPDAKAEWDATQKLKNDPRVTRIGRFMRQTSMDELPQLFNILLGHMSLVGPRPMMLQQKALYMAESYYDLRPGLTGLWQISERNESSFRAREKFDDAYSQIVTFRTDLTILLRTVVVVLRRTGY